MKVLVTGNAGFIGFHTARRLLERGDAVVGIDSVDEYNDPALKEARLEILEETARRCGSRYEFIRGNLANAHVVDDCFGRHAFDRIIHFAAQVGVRYSLVNPRVYVQNNLVAFGNLLEASRKAAAPHFTYASSSSVYGANKALPSSEHQGVDHPLAFYAATKRANELMAHTYSHSFGLPTTGLRFFTVYGPWGRPDMALFLFTKNIIEGTPIQVFNHGNHSRDFTYIDDIVEGVVRASDSIAQSNGDWDARSPDPATSSAPFRIFNIGNSSPVKLAEYIEAIEAAVGRKAVKQLMPIQAGDVAETFADVSELESTVGYRPATRVSDGVASFVRWYREYFRV